MMETFRRNGSLDNSVKMKMDLDDKVVIETESFYALNVDFCDEDILSEAPYKVEPFFSCEKPCKHERDEQVVLQDHLDIELCQNISSVNACFVDNKISNGLCDPGSININRAVTNIPPLLQTNPEFVLKEEVHTASGNDELGHDVKKSYQFDKRDQRSRTKVHGEKPFINQWGNTSCGLEDSVEMRMTVADNVVVEPLHAHVPRCDNKGKTSTGITCLQPIQKFAIKENYSTKSENDVLHYADVMDTSTLSMCEFGMSKDSRGIHTGEKPLKEVSPLPRETNEVLGVTSRDAQYRPRNSNQLPTNPYFSQPGTCEISANLEISYRDLLNEIKTEIKQSEVRVMEFVERKISEVKECVENALLQRAKSVTPSGRLRKNISKHKIDKSVRSWVRSGVKAAEEHGLMWELLQKNLSPYVGPNKQTTNFVIQHVRDIMPNVPSRDINTAIDTYFTSKVASSRREVAGKTKIHQQSCNKGNRKRAKKERRLEALSNANWDYVRKQRFRGACNKYDLQSTDESDYNTEGEKVLVSRLRPFESGEARNEKFFLDKIHATLVKSSCKGLKTGYEGLPSTASKFPVDDEDQWLINQNSE